MAPDEPKSLSVDLDEDLIQSRVQALVERGLRRYGEGDLEGAMSEWEHALALDPDNPRAREYVQYVQKNFEVLDSTFRAAGDVSDASVELGVPFGLEDVGGQQGGEDAYESLEIGEKEPQARPATIDEGWDIDGGWSLDELPGGFDSPDQELAAKEDEGSALELAEVDALELEPAPREIVIEAEAPDDEDSEDSEDSDFGGKTSQGMGEVEPFSSGLSDEAILALGTPTPDETRAAGEATERSAEVSGLEPADLEGVETVERRDDRFGDLELGEAGKGGPSSAEMEQHLASLEADLGQKGTVELASRPLTDELTHELERDEPTAEIARLQAPPPVTASPRGAEAPEVPEAIDFDEVAQGLLARADAGTAEGSRARADALLDLARREHRQGELQTAVVALDLALEEASTSPEAQGLVDEHHDYFLEVYEAHLGESSAVPALAVPLHELEMHRLNHRAAFLLSRIDGALSVEDILDVSGMSRLEAYRHLCRLLAQGILKVR